MVTDSADEVSVCTPALHLTYVPLVQRVVKHVRSEKRMLAVASYALKFSPETDNVNCDEGRAFTLVTAAPKLITAESKVKLHGTDVPMRLSIVTALCTEI
jgi:hypothetical protein